MRQAVTTIIAALFLAFSPLAYARCEGTDASTTTDQARRLIAAKDYSAATILLEDCLPDANARDKPAIIELLRQSYEVMARNAKAAGRDREEAYCLDNLAIIERARGKTTPTKPGDEKPGKPAPPKPSTGETKTSGASKTSGATASTPSRPSSWNVSLLGSVEDAASAPPPVPMPPSEPTKLPMPEPLPVLPEAVASRNAPEATPTKKKPSSTPESKNVSAREQGIASGNRKGPAGAVASQSLPLMRAPDGPVRSDDTPPAAAKPTLADGDRLFAAGKYDDAGRCYAELARQNRLPAHRKEHWAYCRMVEVARRINLRPRSPREWDEIEEEIASIQHVTPNIWYGEYLRTKVAEVRKSGRRALAQSDNLIVRGTEPDESQSQPEPQPRRFPRLFGKSRTAANSQPDAAARAVTPPANAELPLNLPGEKSPPRTPEAVDDGQANGRVSPGDGAAARSQPEKDGAVVRASDDATGVAWQVYETPNFRVFHQDARLAQAAGDSAEAVRAAQAKRWASPAMQKPWAPTCELYLYPSGKIFARETKQPEESPGFSTMMCNGNRVVARRVNLRADHPQMLTAILPHEVTHVVLADLFTTQQIPRWADEGIAVLAEPSAEQEVRAAELQGPLETGRLFDLGKLMAMDYPDAKDWSLYYAQSVSLTRFLVEQGRPEQFVQFIQNTQRDGIEGALRGTYRIAGFAELQERWAEYARRQFSPLKEARRDPGRQPPETEVK